MSNRMELTPEEFYENCKSIFADKCTPLCEQLNLYFDQKMVFFLFTSNYA